MPPPIVNQAEQRQELGPGAEAVIHRVGIPARIFPQAFEKAGDRVELLVDLLGGEQRAVFGIEQEHHPRQDGDQPCIHVVRIVREHVAEQFAVPLVVGRLEVSPRGA